MEIAVILPLVKLNLSLATSAYDSYLTSLINSAISMINREGITLIPSSVEDQQLVTMYAAYLFRKRADDNPVMPRMLRYALNNRLFSESVNEA